MAIGTVGFTVIEGLSVFDAFYMTIITVTTVGFREIIPLSSAGRALTLFVILTGVGTALYTAGIALEIGFANFERRRKVSMNRTIDRLRGHHIVCGFGRIGETVWRQLEDAGAASLVIEMDPERAVVAEKAGALVVTGDATHNEALLEAGIERARSVIACVREDPENIVIVMSAKSIRSDVFVVSRATEPEFERKLLIAGADRVVTPQSVGANRLAAMVLHQDIAEVLDLFTAGGEEFRVQEVTIGEGAPIAGMTIREAQIRQRSGALILMMRDASGVTMVNPEPSEKLHAGAVVTAVGTTDQIAAFLELT